MQIIETKNSKEFDDFLISQNASVLQSWVWGEFHKRMNRKVWRLFVTSDVGRPRMAATVISFPLPKGKSYLYCPHGPVMTKQADPEAVWRLFLDKLSDIVSVENPIFFRVDPKVEKFFQDFDIQSAGFQKIPWDVQPKDSQVLDLSKKEEQLLHEMKPKTRYNIRLSEKKGVKVEHTTDIAKLKFFWQIMGETTKRDRFATHTYNYFLNLLSVLGKQNSVELVLAYYQNRPISGAIVSYFGKTAVYLHGASANRLRAVMAPHALQWEIIREAKRKGMKYYDFGGVAPNVTKKHAWAGITRFKKGFGGNEVSFVGAYDLPFNKIWYRAYRVARGLKKLF